MTTRNTATHMIHISSVHKEETPKKDFHNLRLVVNRLHISGTTIASRHVPNTTLALSKFKADILLDYCLSGNDLTACWLSDTRQCTDGAARKPV